MSDTPTSTPPRPAPPRFSEADMRKAAINVRSLITDGFDGVTLRELQGYANMLDYAADLQARLTQCAEALQRADEAIARGQDVRSESDFAQWRHDAQAMRPHADLLKAAHTPGSVR